MQQFIACRELFAASPMMTIVIVDMTNVVIINMASGILNKFATIRLHGFYGFWKVRLGHLCGVQNNSQTLHTVAV